MVVSITPDGEAAIAGEGRQAGQGPETLFDSLNSEEKQNLGRLLIKLVVAWEEEGLAPGRGPEHCGGPCHARRDGHGQHHSEHGKHRHGCFALKEKHFRSSGHGPDGKIKEDGEGTVV